MVLVLQRSQRRRIALLIGSIVFAVLTASCGSSGDSTGAGGSGAGGGTSGAGGVAGGRKAAG
jgi:hypothetical protein